MIKVDLHTHTSDDPIDSVRHSSAQLVDRAADLGFGAIAITLHDSQLDLRNLTSRAVERGVVLIRGVERTIHGRHVLLLNFPRAAETVKSFESLAALKARHPEGLVVAPHPFFPGLSCLRGLMNRHAHLFDAVEVNAFFTSGVDFNRHARRWALAHDKPLVGNSDAHDLSIFGKCSTLVDAEACPETICAAVKRGLVEVSATPLSAGQAATYFAAMMLRGRRGTPLLRPSPLASR